MPHLALWLVIVWFLALFVFRTALQWWRTGSGGVRGFSGAVGSLEWSAGLLASLGLAAGVLAPLAALASWPGGAPWFSNDGAHGLGALLMALGIAGALAAQMAMGDSWRIGVDAGERTRLVREGLFARVRNPIFSFILLSGVGLVALLPNALSLLALGLTLAGIEFQVRVVEEPYLLGAHGAAYRDYASRVGRFVPGVGLRLDARCGEPSRDGGDGRVAT
jgi:protein-S-isoprenylcysteine O-methyltransferase Ste14